MPYAIRGSWLLMNTIPFRTVSEWTSTLISMHAAVRPTHMYPTHMPVHTVTHIHTCTFTGHTDIYTDMYVNATPT